MKRPVAHAVKNRKTLDVGQGFFMNQIQRKNGNFMLMFNNVESAAWISRPKPYFL